MREITYVAEMVSKAFYAEAPEHKPYLQRSKAAAEGKMPVSIINDRSYRTLQYR